MCFMIKGSLYAYTDFMQQACDGAIKMEDEPKKTSGQSQVRGRKKALFLLDLTPVVNE